MNWIVEIKPSALKQYKKLDSVLKERIKQALNTLQTSDDPFNLSNVKALVGTLKGDYRLRIGDYRILFTPDEKESIIYVYAILPRGNAYK